MFSKDPCTTLSSRSLDHQRFNLSRSSTTLEGVYCLHNPKSLGLNVLTQCTVFSSTLFTSATTFEGDTMDPAVERNSSGMCEALESAACAICPSEASESITDRTGVSLFDLNICFRRSGVEGVTGPLSGFGAGAGAGALSFMSKMIC